MRRYRMICEVALILASLVTQGESETTRDIDPLPKTLRVGDKTYELIEQWLPRDIALRVPGEYLFPEGQPTECLDAYSQYWLKSAVFLRSPDRKKAIPFMGHAPFVGYVDLVKNKFVYYKDAFPPAGQWSGRDTPAPYYWTGALNRENKNSEVLWLFVRRLDRVKRSFTSKLAIIPLNDPGSMVIEEMNHAVVMKVFDRAGGELLCEIADGKIRNWVRMSTDTWSIMASGKPAKGYGRLGRAAYAPVRRDIYVVYAHRGLVVFDSETGNEKAEYEGVGSYINAFTLGATFAPGGSVAVVSTPYQQGIALIDVKARKIISEYKSLSPLCGILFDEKENRAYAYKIGLPYE